MLQHSKASERANVRIETINFLNDFMFDDIDDDNDKEGGLSSFAAQLHVERRDARTGKGLLAYPTIKVLQKGHATISETIARVATCMHGVTVVLCNHNPGSVTCYSYLYM